MQLTRFDRWLRQKFVYETHFYTMREVEHPPVGVAGFKLAAKEGQRFHYKYIVRAEKSANEMSRILRADSMMFTTRIVNRNAWYVPILAPEGKSVTWMLVSYVALMLFLGSLAYGAVLLWSNPVIRQNILESIEILKG